MAVPHSNNDRQLAVAVCQVLGIDANRVRRIEIILNAGSVSVIEVEMYLTQDGEAGVATEIIKHRWQLLPELLEESS